MKTKRSWDNVRPSKLAVGTVNPIRQFVETLKKPNPEIPVISLSIGESFLIIIVL